MAVSSINIPTGVGFHINTPPAGFAPEKDLPKGFMKFFEPLHKRFTPWQQQLIQKRKQVLADAHRGKQPAHLPPSEATKGSWHIELPDWCQDQRNQMTGPGDEADLVVKLLNSGAPGVLLDFEDSTVNEWDHQRLAEHNILEGMYGKLSYFDKKRNKTVSINRSKTVIWIRPRGLHMSQAGIFKNELTSASLFDTAIMAYRAEPADLPHPLSFYVPKSESAEEALWWRDLFQELAKAKRLPKDYIKCMALVEAHSLAFQMEEFMYNLRDHVLGLDLGRWDYMASLIDGYMEDLATDRIYRLMIAQRMKHSDAVPILDEHGKAVPHTRETIHRLFDEEVEKIIANPARADIGTPETFREARRISEAMILNGEFDPF